MSGNNGRPNDENDYERGVREERARIEAKLWKVMETTPKDGLSGVVACIRGLVSFAKTVDERLGAVCEDCQDRCKCRSAAGTENDAG